MGPERPHASRYTKRTVVRYPVDKALTTGHCGKCDWPPQFGRVAETRFDMKKSNIAPLQERRSGLLPSIASVLVFASFALGAASVQSAEQNSELKLQENAPDRHVVERGDTLWGIAGKFLKDPWRWGDLWRMNKDQVKNPNRIYPGDVIVLDKTTRTASIRPTETVRLSPQVREEKTGDDAIVAIPPRFIEPFLSQPLVIEAGGLEKAPRIVATQENRVNLGPGGLAYAIGVGGNTRTTWQIYRPGRELVDPDSKAVLGTEAVFLGTARVTRDGDPSTIEIVSAKREISNGDRLIAAGPVQMTQYIPHPPAVFMQGKVIGLYDGLATSESGRNSIIAINRGKRDGIEEGHVLAILRAGSMVADRESKLSRDTAPTFSLPAERYGLLMVFRVFDAVSYALVMESTRPVSPGDAVQTP